MHPDSTIEIEQEKKSEDRGIVAHDDREMVAVNPSSSNQTSHDFHTEIPYKY